MHRASWKLWAAAVFSAALLELPFPLAGPMPPWRSIFAWFALVPLLAAVLSCPNRSAPHPLRRAFLLGYVCGVLWYAGNCYWIYDTMYIYGGLPAWASAFMLAGFSLVLGLYFGIFAWAVLLVRRSTRDVRWALAAAPVLWTALDLASARITSVPWDQLGYSQIDNAILTHLAPWTGVYGISFVLVGGNALIAGGLLIDRCRTKRIVGIAGVILACGLTAGVLVPPREPAATATAVLIQPDLNVGINNLWSGPVWNQHVAQFARLAQETCGPYVSGIPQTGAPHAEIPCAPNPAHPDLVAWPESPAPFFEQDPRFEKIMSSIAQQVHAPLVVNAIGSDYSAVEGQSDDFVSALVFNSEGRHVGRYDKIHLVPFGEYIPFHQLFFFAHKLAGAVPNFTHGKTRKVFLLDGHRYGVFICYEAVFADEVRHFTRLGAQVLVNISDDGWYGDTSAPWQHLNMARMRAVENRRWLLRDTNNGVTASIDPYGRVRQSIPRHQVGALAARFGFRDDITFYAAHGDLFAWACAILSIGVVILCLQLTLDPRRSKKPGKLLTR
ncbi:MAG TPA: apolipoprotein N-acyltransferase [Bryobacteraceae bacterium]|nr:apolipoprotein N-acyltransferase [Bryobacteraceae bacterium]